jgi:SUKH-3 immunity protein
MTKAKLTPKAIEILSQAGWDKRHREVNTILEDLRNEQFEAPSKNVLDFLNEFNGISFDVFEPEFQRRKEVCLGPEKALEVIFPDGNLMEHQVIIQKRLYPIGSIDLYHSGDVDSYERLVLLLADDNSVYSSISYSIAQYGIDVYDAINRIIDGTELWKTNDALRISYSNEDSRLVTV